jgi:hypothetical protein
MMKFNKELAKAGALIALDRIHVAVPGSLPDPGHPVGARVGHIEKAGSVERKVTGSGPGNRPHLRSCLGT